MKRNLEICRNCSCFVDSESIGHICKKSNDAFLILYDEITTHLSGGMWIPRDMLGMESNEKKPLFDEKDIPEECIMKAEYCLKEWNEEKN